ncbi:hypothetical protein GUJ93_ZPchr0009g512 [Zizania palustris]|uniref:Uncharacterized protein n=1 Tax=Zizania palustris TaxID=103762 RepID=A0A8J5RLA3_ZIZPA|nr:hypothetical protein GUJ93_ZPchr0009g512 [Zizania palustris]
MAIDDGSVEECERDFPPRVNNKIYSPHWCARKSSLFNRFCYFCSREILRVPACVGLKIGSKVGDIWVLV